MEIAHQGLKLVYIWDAGMTVALLATPHCQPLITLFHTCYSDPALSLQLIPCHVPLLCNVCTFFLCSTLDSSAAVSMGPSLIIPIHSDLFHPSAPVDNRRLLSTEDVLVQCVKPQPVRPIFCNRMLVLVLAALFLTYPPANVMDDGPGA